MKTFDIRPIISIEEYLDACEREGFTSTPFPEKFYAEYDTAPIVFSAEANPCGTHCRGNHPGMTVKKFGRWFVLAGQDIAAGIHVSGMDFFKPCLEKEAEEYAKRVGFPITEIRIQ